MACGRLGVGVDQEGPPAGMCGEAGDVGCAARLSGSALAGGEGDHARHVAHGPDSPMRRVSACATTRRMRRLISRVTPPVTFPAYVSPLVLPVHLHVTDRKSTRLNSSH